MSLQAGLANDKGDLPTAGRRSGIIRYFRKRKEFPGKQDTKDQDKMNQRTKYFQLRLTPEEYKELKDKAVKYNSVSEYIRTALQEFSDMDTQERIRMMTDLGQFYRDYNNRLSWTGSNLNQSVKRANELAVAGQLTGAYVKTILLPVIQHTNTLIYEMKQQLLTLTKSATKF